MVRPLAELAACCAIALPLLCAAPAPGAPVLEPEPCTAGAKVCWDPEPTASPWQWQLQGRVNLSVPAPVYDVDLDVGRSVIEAIHAQGDRAICYVSVGTPEPFRRGTRPRDGGRPQERPRTGAATSPTTTSRSTSSASSTGSAR